MHDAAVEEDWRDEAEPLVRLRGLSAVGEGCDAHAEAAEVIEGAEPRCRRGE